MGNAYQTRLSERRAIRKLRDATLVVEAFEKFIDAKIDDANRATPDSFHELVLVRKSLIDFLCQSATKG